MTRSQKCQELYDLLIPSLRAVARGHGYALAVHGSLARDIDLVAVPWVREVSPMDVLAKALVDKCLERVVDEHRHQYPRLDENGTEKPHGRRAWTLMLCHEGVYIDLSVFPPGGDP